MRLSALLFSLSACSLASASLFDVTSVTTGSNASASGTSNGIGFTLTSEFIWNVRTVTNGTYQGFTGGNFAIPMPNSDVLHGSNVSITFAETVQTVLVYVADDDNGSDAVFDFGIVPEVLSGSVVVSGTAFGASAVAGGLVRLNNVNSNTLFSPIAADGNDYAIVANPVPEPGSIALIGLGLAAMARRPKRR